jgi:lambda family phage minor tail protein L
MARNDDLWWLLNEQTISNWTAASMWNRVRHVTLDQYLDARNFDAGNPAANPAQEFPADVYFVEQKTSETNEVVEFELASVLDLQGQMLPRRQIIANLCSFTYKVSYCNYTGGAMFDGNDQAMSDPALDVCSKRLTGCRSGSATLKS